MVPPLSWGFCNPPPPRLLTPNSVCASGPSASADRAGEHQERPGEGGHADGECAGVASGLGLHASPALRAGRHPQEDGPRLQPVLCLHRQVSSQYEMQISFKYSY